MSSSLVWMVLWASLAAAASFLPAPKSHFWPLSSHSLALSFSSSLLGAPAYSNVLVPLGLHSHSSYQKWHQAYDLVHRHKALSVPRRSTAHHITCRLSCRTDQQFSEQ